VRKKKHPQALPKRMGVGKVEVQTEVEVVAKTQVETGKVEIDRNKTMWR